MQKVIGLWTQPQMLAAGRRAAWQGGRVLKVKHILASTVSGRALGINDRCQGFKLLRAVQKRRYAVTNRQFSSQPQG